MKEKCVRITMTAKARSLGDVLSALQTAAQGVEDGKREGSNTLCVWHTHEKTTEE